MDVLAAAEAINGDPHQKPHVATDADERNPPSLDDAQFGNLFLGFSLCRSLVSKYVVYASKILVDPVRHYAEYARIIIIISVGMLWPASIFICCTCSFYLPLPNMCLKSKFNTYP